MSADKLAAYRSKRDADKTPEPSGEGDSEDGGSARFVVQEHHARRLHWDLRLERDGVLISWALPRGVPDDPSSNRLAVHVEDHPLEYIDFAGTIPEGQYGAGKVEIWDSGSYEAHKFRSDEVIVTFHGERLNGKYALFQTDGKNWLIHRMDPPADPSREPPPEHLEPMLARLAEETPPNARGEWAFELKWDGIRAIAFAETGRLRIENRNQRDITARYPELRALGRELGSREAVLDGEIVALDENGRPSFQRLQSRMHLSSEGAVRRRMKDIPATYVIFDVLHLDGRPTLTLPYSERRELLDELGLEGPSWRTPDNHLGDGAALLELARGQDLEGIVAKRLDGRYEPGRRSGAWLKVKAVSSQELVVGGWMPGKGGRSGGLGSLLVGYYDGGRLRYAGRVGTGLTQADLDLLAELLDPLRTEESPFEGRQPPREAIFTEPRLVVDVRFLEWTSAGTLRAPVYRGLRDDLEPAEIVRVEPS